MLVASPGALQLEVVGEATVCPRVGMKLVRTSTATPKWMMVVVARLHAHVTRTSTVRVMGIAHHGTGVTLPVTPTHRSVIMEGAYHFDGRPLAENGKLHRRC